ncbi:MAG: prephenate dehydrogenase [Bacteroidetes bacterium RIFCSPLOWO2_12_FULL_31_6]|nr:MAG: prephenate dehydrogenase [Bacteroidetes bacterium RIFCSPLOWO2_12_FULL_31_6]
MTITVIGLGLIGGSMALDLKERGYAKHIIGVDNDKEHCKKALKIGFVDEIKTMNDALNSDLIILSIPVTETAKLLPKILDLIGENTVVMDVGSTKQNICKAIKKHHKRKQFIGTHPIAGTENSGPTAAIKNLFDNKTCILCVDVSALWVVERVSKLYEKLNMKILFMKAEEHDMHVAYVSHISHISSFALATTVLEIEKNASTIFDLAGSGFASTVRLAKSSPDMWAPIFEHNSKYISKALGTYIKHLTKFKENIDKKNTKATHKSMIKSNAIRKILK